ncbi:hypothetical protein PAXINDRAFT_167548 [Paxillus involutus ATCC 200175]|nr:hypothetical protein PAXINDRAFT_167548 [Paxillus involutus ATCC 200175]
MVKHLTGESALAFLLVHDPEEAQHLGLLIPLKSKHAGQEVDFELVSDFQAYLTVKTTSEDPLEQDITVKVSDIELDFKHTGGFDYPNKFPYPLLDCDHVEGTLYTIGEPPTAGDSFFNAQQFPQYPPVPGKVQGNSLAGRVLIDFWDGERITGVFKTNEENFVSGGTGEWLERE